MRPVGPNTVSDTLDETRTQQIRHAAADLFQRSGYTATTMNDVANAVDILPGSVYHHFPSKEHIALAILEEFHQALDSLSRDFLARTSATAGHPAADRVIELSEAVSRLSFTHAAAVRLRCYEAPTVASPLLHDAVAHLPQSYDRAWRSSVAQLKSADVAPDVDNGLLRYTLRTATLDASLSHVPATEPDAPGRFLAEALLNGVAVSPPDDLDLESSRAFKVANEAMSSWPSPADSTDQLILRAARTEFARCGYDATTVRDIARAAGVGIATLYRRTDSKQALLSQILREFSSHVGLGIQAILSCGDNPVAVVDALARLMVSANRRFNEEAEIVKYSWLGRESVASPIHDYYVATEQRLRVLSGVLDTGMQDGTIRPAAPPEFLAMTLRWAFWLPYQEYGRVSEARAHRFLRRAFLHGAFRT